MGTVGGDSLEICFIHALPGGCYRKKKQGGEMVGAVFLGPAVHSVALLCVSSAPGYNRGERWECIYWHGTNMAAARETPAIVTVRRCGASSCRGRSRLSRTCLAWRRTRAPARGRALAQVRHRQWPRLQLLRPRLHWHHRPRPLTDPPPDAFSTWETDADIIIQPVYASINHYWNLLI